jgi:hypothetical protein
MVVGDAINTASAFRVASRSLGCSVKSENNALAIVEGKHRYDKSPIYLMPTTMESGPARGST